MSAFAVQKAENCFAASQTFSYTVAFEMTEEKLRSFISFGLLEIKRNYRRPFYFIRGEQMEIRGILNEKHFKVSFSPEEWQKQKMDFEKHLEQINE